MKKLILAASALLLASLFSSAHATIIYFSDDQGRVGQYDDVADTVSPVGDLTASFSVSQVIGIAWDAANNRILILDRGAPAVYAMDPGTGTSSLLFDPGIQFQGGAVVGSTLYGIDENTQTVEAFDLGSFANLNLSEAALAEHSHALGVNPAGGQLYAGGDTIFTVSSTGAGGGSVVDPTVNMEDIDYYNGDFLAATYDSNLLIIDGTSGTDSEFLSAAQLTSAGLASSVSGVAVASASVAAIAPRPVPTLNQWALALLALMMAAVAAMTFRWQAQARV